MLNQSAPKSLLLAVELIEIAMNNDVPSTDAEVAVLRQLEARLAEYHPLEQQSVTFTTLAAVVSLAAGLAGLVPDAAGRLDVVRLAATGLDGIPDDLSGLE